MTTTHKALGVFLTLGMLCASLVVVAQASAGHPEPPRSMQALQVASPRTGGVGTGGLPPAPIAPTGPMPSVDGGVSGLTSSIGVTITGPVTGTVAEPCAFLAAAGPVTVTTPITYAWEATGQPPVTHAASLILTDSVTFTWSTEMTGTQTISVTITGVDGVATDTHVIDILSRPPTRVYVPVVLNDWPPPGIVYPVEDTHILEGYPGTNYGTAPQMWAGYDDYPD
jgi:hypothetical protein